MEWLKGSILFEVTYLYLTGRTKYYGRHTKQGFKLCLGFSFHQNLAHTIKQATSWTSQPLTQGSVYVMAVAKDE